MRKLACNHRPSQRPLRTVVGRCDRRIVKEQQHPSAIMLQTDSVEQPLVVLILQRAGTQMDCEFVLNPFGLGREVAGLAGPLVAPELAGFPQDALQLQPKTTCGSGFAFQHLINIFFEVIQTFLLFHAQ